MLNLNLALADLPLLQSQTSRKDRVRLTFGVEIEFNLATLDEFDADDDPTPDDTRAVLGITGSRIFDNHSHLERVELARKHVAKTLSDEGVPAEALDETNPTWKPTDITAWIVKSDNTIKPPDGNICVPFLSNRNYYAGLLFQRSCGEYGEEGNGKKSLDLNTTRKLFTTLYTFEPQIAHIHPSHRINNGFCQSLRVGSRLAKQLIDSGQSVAGPGLHLLRNAETMDEFKNYTTKADVSDGRLAYHMGNLLPDPTVHEYDPDKKTVEFRQHQSTLDPERVAHWARLCAGLVEFADGVDDEKLHAFLERHIDHSLDEFHVGQVLAALGMSHLAPYYQRRIEKRD